MKKRKRLLALVGVILLIVLYLLTLVAAVCGNGSSINLLMASVTATIVIPVLIWSYSLVFRMLHKDAPNDLMGNASDAEESAIDDTDK